MENEVFSREYHIISGVSYFVKMKTELEKLKKIVWCLTYGLYYRYCYWRTSSMRNRLHILNSEETVQYIIQNRCSVSRFGDGEFQMITHFLNNGTTENFHVDTFQRYEPRLACRLIDVLRSPIPNHLVCIPYAFHDSSVWKGYQRIFFERDWLLRLKDIISRLDLEKSYGDSCFTRFYYGRRDIKNYDTYIELLKKIWDKRNLLIVEGEHSRLGVCNNLFDNASVIHRILCPTTNAFTKYDEILSAVRKMSQTYLVLIALGHTATVCAYDLSKYGYQAIDIGHIDIEYEWLKMRAKHKVAVPNKYVNESKEGRILTSVTDSTYQSQIIGRIE